MLSYWDNSVYCSPLAEVLSLDTPPPKGERGAPTHWGVVADLSEDAETRLDDLQAATAVAAFISRLPVRDQDVIRRVFWDNERQAEVARRLGLSRMAITKIVQRVARLGRQQLKEFRSFSLN